MHTSFWWINLKIRDDLEDAMQGDDIIKDLKEMCLEG
jgi:hypothetical protein